MFLRSNLHSMILFISEQHTVVCPAAWGTGDGTCAVDDEYDYDSDCDTPASDCDEDEGPSGFWQLTRKVRRRPGLAALRIVAALAAGPGPGPAGGMWPRHRGGDTKAAAAGSAVLMSPP